MPRIEREAHIQWEGTTARGAGTITGESGAFATLPFSLPSRIGLQQGKTSPEELLAAAHAGCLTMSLGTELAAAGTPPGKIETTCRIVMDEVQGEGHQIVGSQVSIRAEAEGASREALQEALEKADAGCPFSTLLKNAGVDVQIVLAA
jgi:osmotically inducible protein OsmC